MRADQMTNPLLSARIAVVIPAYKVTRHIGAVILKMPAMVWRIYVIDDAEVIVKVDAMASWTLVYPLFCGADPGR
jgi:hypothetical protein